jgi:hypothetical protein
MYIKQTMFLGYTALQLFRIATRNVTSHDKRSVLLHQYFPAVRVQCPIWLFSVVT